MEGGGAALGLVAITVVAASSSAVEAHRLRVVVAFLVVEHKMIILWQTVHLLFDCFLSSL